MRMSAETKVDGSLEDERRQMAVEDGNAVTYTAERPAGKYVSFSIVTDRMRRAAEAAFRGPLPIVELAEKVYRAMREARSDRHILLEDNPHNVTVAYSGRPLLSDTPNELDDERKERERVEQSDAIMERLAAIEAKLDNPLICMQVEPPCSDDDVRFDCLSLAVENCAGRDLMEWAEKFYAFVRGPWPGEPKTKRCFSDLPAEVRREAVLFLMHREFGNLTRDEATEKAEVLFNIFHGTRPDQQA